MQSFQIAPLDSKFFGHYDGVKSHSLEMIVSSLVFGLNGKGEGLNGSQVQVGHLLNVPLLVFQFAQIQAVRTVDDVNRGNKQKRSFPVEFVVEPADRSGDARA